MNIKLVIGATVACVGLFFTTWLWLQIKPLTVLYEVQSDASVLTDITGSIKQDNSDTTDSVASLKQVILKMKQHIISLEKLIKHSEQDFNYWNKEQRQYQLYSPPINSKARSGWVKDYNAAKSNKKYYRKQLNEYKALKK